jgi:hypothetical protein
MFDDRSQLEAIMVRATASLVVLTVFAGIGSACPWWGRCWRDRTANDPGPFRL